MTHRRPDISNGPWARCTRLLLLVVWGMSLFACASDTGSVSSEATSGPSAHEHEHEILSGTDEQIFVGDTIEQQYDPHVIMKRAESYFEKESYLEAIVEYKHFLDLHRNHVLASYAQYKIAGSHFHRFKTIDRDPEPIRESLTAYRKLVTNFPDSRYVTDATVHITRCEELLAEHDLFVGTFYYERESYLAAAHRFEHIIDAYPHIEIAGNAMYQLARTYQKLGAAEWTRDWLVKLVRTHPRHAQAQQGRALLARLRTTNPDLDIPTLPEPSAPLDSTVQMAQAAPPTPAKALDTVPTSVNHQTPVVIPSALGSASRCDVGTWCTSENTSQDIPAPAPASSIATCRPGQWC